MNRNTYISEDDRAIIDASLKEYFAINPETIAWSDDIYAYMNGKLPEIDDSILPHDIANIVRSRDGRELLNTPWKWYATAHFYIKEFKDYQYYFFVKLKNPNDRHLEMYLPFLLASLIIMGMIILFVIKVTS